MSDAIAAILPGLNSEAEPKPYTLSLLERSLANQRDLAAVERFTSRHDAGTHDLEEGLYRELLPARPPSAGEQYAFEVNLDACSGCKACVSACHSLNGLDESETWRSVGLLHGGTDDAPAQRTVTTACHHCLDPACMNGCPVNAYEKDPVTGIVRHLDDQCIGCQYCIFTCPYEVPKFNERLGIVRKCDMCADRLTAGEAPACVQGCPSGAISIALVARESILEDARAGTFLPGAPSPRTTAPTTRYVSASPLPASLRPADEHAVSPAHRHGPLVALLVLTQLSAGAFFFSALTARHLGATPPSFGPLSVTLAFSFGLLGLFSSVTHLGRPAYGFRAVLNVRRSWMSREVLAFGAFTGVSGALFATEIGSAAFIRTLVPEWASSLSVLAHHPLALATSAMGVASVFCSVMLYHVTGRGFWHASRTAPRFFGTAVVLGLASTCLALAVAKLIDGGDLAPVTMAGRALIAATGAKLVFEAAFFVNLRPRAPAELQRSARLLLGPLERTTFGRFALGAVGGVIVPLFLLAAPAPNAEASLVVGSTIAVVFCSMGEALERSTFFTASSAPRMPGGIPG
jgi:formate dehydrogenase iron-sulfur subunit